jgi:hypothetical protein
VPAHRALDLLRGVGAGGRQALPGRQQDHPTGLADGERGADVDPEVQLFDGQGVGLMAVEEIADRAVDLGQPLLGRGGGARLDYPGVQRAQARARALHYAVAGVRGSGVDSEDDHGEAFCAGLRTPA